MQAEKIRRQPAVDCSSWRAVPCKFVTPAIYVCIECSRRAECNASRLIVVCKDRSVNTTRTGMHDVSDSASGFLGQRQGQQSANRRVPRRACGVLLLSHRRRGSKKTKTLEKQNKQTNLKQNHKQTVWISSEFPGTAHVRAHSQSSSLSQPVWPSFFP